MKDRRDFLKKIGIAAGGAASVGFLPSTLLGQPVHKVLDKEPFQGLATIDIKGSVTSGGYALSNVVITDGVTVTSTDENGSFSLITSPSQDFIYMSTPSGYKINSLQNGSARFFLPIVKENPEQEIHFELEELKESDKKHHFVVLADPQIQNAYEVEQFLTVAMPDVKKTIESIESSNVFGIGCGDLVFDCLELFKDYNEGIKSTGVPFFQVLGNHDMDLGVRSDEMTTSTFNQLFGPQYYSFNRGDVHYVVLDDVFFIGVDKKYIGYINEVQLSWLEKDLSYVPHGTTVVVALHIPTYTGAVKRYPDRDSIGGIVNNRQHLYKLLEPYNTHILSGHTHFNDNMLLKDNLFEHCHGTLCGAWWSGPICYDGTPSGYGVYSVEGSKLSWYYKSTGKDKTHQLRVYEKGRHPEFQDCWCVNIWNWDPEWTITWFENGKSKGAPERIVARDPLSIELHDGPELPKRRKWVEPQLSDHMFFFDPSPKAKTIKVEAVDRFGNVYSETVTV